MNNELQLLQEIKNTFGWPVDTFRYGLLGEKRFWNGIEYQSELAENISEKVRFSLSKVKIAQDKLRALARLPWVQMIFITGSVASLNAKREDDIDVWLVVDPKRIWLTRALDFLLYTFSGKRRLSSDGVEATRVMDKFCFNFYTTTETLQLGNHSISFAMQFIDALPLYIKDLSVYANLIEQNSWIKEFFPSWYAQKEKELSKNKVNNPKSSSNLLFDSVEYIAGVLMVLKSEKKLKFSPKKIFRSQFTTWGTPRILSQYDNETLTEGSQESK